MFDKRILIIVIVALAIIGCAPASSTNVTSLTQPSSPTLSPTSALTIASTAVPTTAPTTTAILGTATPSSVTITDVAGRKVTLNGTPQRIISLAPSNTEILFALDLGPRVVAVDDFSDFPAEVKALPKIGGSSDKYNFEQIVALKPDVIFAAGITSPDVLRKLEDLHLTVVVLGVEKTTFDSILTDIALAGQITGRGDQAK